MRAGEAATVAWARAVNAAFLLFLCALPAKAAVQDRLATDVTPRAFSVVWVSDQPVTAATVRVYDDSAGTTDLTAAFGQSTVSAAVPGAHALGLVRVDVRGLAAGTCYHYRTETTAGALVLDPPAPPYPQVCTTQAIRRANGAGAPIVNDLVRHPVYEADGTTPLLGALVVADLPGLAHSPLSSFVRTDSATPRSLLDFANVFDAATGESAELLGGEVIQLNEYPGIACGGTKRVRFRKMPAHAETSVFGFAISEVEVADSCFFADTDCSDTVDVLDAQRVLATFGAQSGECSFNPDLDSVADQRIDILDVQNVLNRLGESAPFTP